MKNLFIHSSFLHSFLSELFQPFQKPLAMVFGIFDDPLPVFFGADAGNVSAAEAVHRRLIDHVAELGHLLKVVEKFFYRMPDYRNGLHAQRIRSERRESWLVIGAAGLRARLYVKKLRKFLVNARV